jgi:hypothetical protein
MSVSIVTRSPQNKLTATPFYFRLFVAVALGSAIGRMYMESVHIVAPFTTLSSKPMDWRVKEASQKLSQGVIRGTIMYLPKEAVEESQKNNRGDAHFVSQARWFLRSWEESCQYLNTTDRIDVMIVVSDDILTQTKELLRRWDCQPTIRTDRWQPSACRLISGFVPVHERENEILRDYRFANSIDCVVHAASQKALDVYDKVLRTDMDTFLTPLFASWLPEKFIVGKGAYCFPQFDTCERLHKIADKMGLSPPNASAIVDNVGSTWYGDAATMIRCSKTSMDVMRYLWEHEFNKTEKRKGGWPHWHPGVNSMYSGNIAMNYCAHAVGFDKRPDMLDFPSNSGQSIWKAVHVHTWQDRNDFSKFVYREGGYEDVKLDALNLNVTKDYAMFMALDGNRKDNITDISRHPMR